jgi:hypothetical protein
MSENSARDNKPMRIDGQTNMAIPQECTRLLSIDGSRRTRAIFLRKIEATIDHEGETA